MGINGQCLAKSRPFREGVLVQGNIQEIIKVVSL